LANLYTLFLRLNLYLNLRKEELLKTSSREFYQEVL
jgi:hypothetical protein